MLTELTIKNYALIDQLHVNFNTGLTIITGETGAGKSILLGGLLLILGKRADLSDVKDNSKKCVIEATFDIANYSLKPVFNKENLDYEALTIIRREILPSGKSRAFVNDSPVNLDSLQILGERLIDIHSQHQTLKLTNDNFQFQVIDALANNSNHLSNYSKLLAEYRSLNIELDSLKAKKTSALKELDYHTFLLKELEDAQLIEGEQETLESEYETLNNVEDIKERLTLAHQMMINDEVGIISNLSEIKNQFSRLSGYSNQYQNLFQRIESSLIELNDVFSEIESINENLDANPDRLNQVNTKLQVIHNLLQKHTAANIEELISIKNELGSKVIETEQIDTIIAEKEFQIKSIESKLNTESEVIHNNRTAILPELITQLESILSSLGMPNAKFKIELNLSEQFLNNGRDQLELLFSANKGGQFNELKKSASGGELSRIMLAIKYILSKYMQLPTIMFDEIDTGVSGEISNKMAKIMQDMSKSMQVFTITHFPQIAAKGDTHFKVYKEDVNNVTQTQLKQLSHNDRIVEIAQMLGGSDVSSSALAHAKELLN